MAKIEELTGIKRSEPQIRRYLKSIGFKRRKVGMIPAKSDPEIQKSSKKKNFNQCLSKLKMVPEKFTLLMPLQTESFGSFSWLLMVFLSLVYSSPLLVESVLTFWVRWMPLPIS